MICRVDSSGIDIENNNFISSVYYITGKNKEVERLVFSVRVGQKEFSKKDSELIKRILTSITF